MRMTNGKIKSEDMRITFNREQVDHVPGLCNVLVHHSHDVVVAPHADKVVSARAHVSELRFCVIVDTVFHHQKRVPGRYLCWLVYIRKLLNLSKIHEGKLFAH